MQHWSNSNQNNDWKEHCTMSIEYEWGDKCVVPYISIMLLPSWPAVLIHNLIECVHWVQWTNPITLFDKVSLIPHKDCQVQKIPNHTATMRTVRFSHTPRMNIPSMTSFHTLYWRLLSPHKDDAYQKLRVELIDTSLKSTNSTSHCQRLSWESLKWNTAQS